MAVNLKKGNPEHHKISLKKEERKPIKLETTEDKDYSITGSSSKNTNASLPIGALNPVDEKKADRADKKRVIFGILLAILLLLLVVGFLARNIVKKKNDEKLIKADSEAYISDEESINNQDDGMYIKNNNDENISTEDSQLTEEEVDDLESREQFIEEETEEEAADESEEIQHIDDPAIHSYEVCIADVTWREAFEACKGKGGYLCRINSEEENNVIINMLNEKGVHGVVFLGGLREEDSNDYHWVDTDEIPYDDVINEGEYRKYWYDGEPSYKDNVDGIDINEQYMALIYPGSIKTWVWNDVSNDVLSLSPGYYKGRLSYICEFE